jgi:hypothetical protein
MARHRSASRRLGRWLVPCTAVLCLWLGDNDPWGAAGFGSFLALGLVLALFWPLLAVLALEAPGAVVPATWRASWRHGDVTRPHISTRLRRVVYAADRHRCCYCRSSARLQLDHVKPWSLGGRTSLWNLCTLCSRCNKVKSNYWVHRDGRITYRSWEGFDWPSTAGLILAFELRHRRSVTRLIRAAVAL